MNPEIAILYSKERGGILGHLAGELEAKRYKTKAYTLNDGQSLEEALNGEHWIAFSDGLISGDTLKEYADKSKGYLAETTSCTNTKNAIIAFRDHKAIDYVPLSYSHGLKNGTSNQNRSSNCAFA